MHEGENRVSESSGERGYVPLVLVVNVLLDVDVSNQKKNKSGFSYRLRL